jgi:ParB family chromosome partitioning protein
MKEFNLLNMVSQNNQVKYIPVDILVPYHNHQFKLYTGERFDDMVESIRKNGVLNPILVQPIEGGKYEILSGHNRVEGAKTVGLNTIPAVVKENLSEEEAEMYVIETNLIQRGFNELLISEQANILGYRYSQMFSQGKRNDIINEINRLEGKELKNEDSLDTESTCDPGGHKLKSRDVLAKEYSLGTTTIARLIRINQLIESLKTMVDDKTMPIKVAVELSYIPEDGQQMVYDVLTAHKKKLNIKQSKAVRQLFTDGEVTPETLENLIVGESTTKHTKKMVKVSLDEETFSKYFDKNTSEEEVLEILKEALEKYFA